MRFRLCCGSLDSDANVGSFYEIWDQMHLMYEHKHHAVPLAVCKSIVNMVDAFFAYVICILVMVACDSLCEEYGCLVNDDDKLNYYNRAVMIPLEIWIILFCEWVYDQNRKIKCITECYLISNSYWRMGNSHLHSQSLYDDSINFSN